MAGIVLLQATQVTSSSFVVGRTPPAINAIGTSVFNWGALLNPSDDDEVVVVGRLISS